jgi:rod shape determining protein RodA
MRVRNFLEIDFFILFAVLGLAVIGILFIYSSGISSEGSLISTEYLRQIVWVSFGLILALAISALNYKRIYDFSFYFYLGTLVLLVVTVLLGRFVYGSRWLRIGGFGFQASEFAKIATILFLAWYLDSRKRNQGALIRFIFSGVIVLLPMLLVLLQPDLGTALVFIPILLGMTYVAGIPIRYILFLVLCIACSGIFLILPLWQTAIMNNSIPALMALVNTRFVAAACITLALILAIAAIGFIRYEKSYFYWLSYIAGISIFSLSTSFIAGKTLREYQLMRLIVFIDPNVDPRGYGWQIIQSTTAIGSGGAFGKGFLQGTQSHYHFLPEQSTDFIFSILSEEWGFIGGILLFSLFLILLLRLIRIMRITTDSFGAYIVAGLISMYAFHFIINVGMTMGIMPVTGIPLMFVSYGGSAMVSAMLGIGLAFSVHVRRYLQS